MEKLAAYASRRPGLTSSSAAALLVEEGLRMDAHPGIVFRDGPSGRRAGLASGPDVWEVARVIRNARMAEPELPTAELLSLVQENTGLPSSAIRVALGYYGAFADEIDGLVAAAEAAETQAEEAFIRTQRLLDAS